MITTVRAVTLSLAAIGLAAGLALALGSPDAEAFFTPRILVAGIGVGVLSLVIFGLTFRGRDGTA